MTEQKTAAQQQGPRKKKMAPTKYSMSGGLVGFLAAQNISLAFSSYQSGKLYLVGRGPKGGLRVNERFFQKAMGISVQDKDTILLVTAAQILRFKNTLDPGQFINKTEDACFVPRVSYTTGALDGHDVGQLSDGTVVFVNTRFNCIATLSDRKSFKPIWKPKFVSQIINEDRCHLNGMAIENGELRYASAVSKSNTIDGWRDRRDNGGIVIDIKANKIVCEGLSMPHSPRMHDGKLWVLNSGTGELGWVEIGKTVKTSKFHPVAFCPGFVRGLSFHGKYAFVGLSKPRYKRFEGLELDKKLEEADSEPWCGVQIIDIETGACIQWLRLDGGVAELYDVGVVPDVACPMSLGMLTKEIATLLTHEELAG